MPNLYLATAQGLIRNGVYTPFATPVSIDANYPYTHPNYLNGIQYQIYLLIGTGLTYTVTNLTPTQKEYKLSVIASSYNISALRVLLNDNDTTYDIPVNQITCASEGSQINKIVRMMPAPGYNDVVQGGGFNTYLPNAKYGCKFTDIVKSTLVDTIVKEIMIDGTKYPINLLPQDTQQIEVVINGLGKGVYQVSYSEPPDTPTVELTVIKTSRDLYHPQAISIVTPNGGYIVGEQEKVRAFELLDAIIDEQFHQPVLWTDDDNCITEEERDALIKKALTMCPNCC